MKSYFKYFAVIAFAMTACEPQLENPITEPDFYSNGEANFTNYVALGNSLTAGYADGSLYRFGQINSYPNILAQQFAVVQETEEFRQPLVNDNAGGLLAAGNPIPGFDTRLVLAFDQNGNPSPRRYRGAQPTTEVTDILEGPFNNLGVPGAKSYHLVAPNYGSISGLLSDPITANPYFARFASSPGTTVLQDALAQDPSFFTLWIGNNDVLGYATSGGAGIDRTGSNVAPNAYEMEDITDPAVFASVYTQMVQALSATTTGGVLITIPDVTSIPFFTTVPSNAIPLDQTTATQLNTRFSAYNNQILPALVQAGILSSAEAQTRQINFSAGQNFVTLVDEDLTDITQMLQQAPFNLDAQTAMLLGQLRQATAEDLIPLTASGYLGSAVNGDATRVNGVSVPLEDEYVLTAREQEYILVATQKYNETISNLAEEFDLGLVDVNILLNQLANGGIPYDAGVVTSSFVTGGAFSLDGIHLTPRGYSLIANAIIEEINQTYNSEVPKVNPGNYGTITLSQDVQ